MSPVHARGRCAEQADLEVYARQLLVVARKVRELEESVRVLGAAVDVIVGDAIRDAEVPA